MQPDVHKCQSSKIALRTTYDIRNALDLSPNATVDMSNHSQAQTHEAKEPLKFLETDLDNSPQDPSCSDTPKECDPA